MEKELDDVKQSLEFEEDFTFMTVLTYLKENENKFLLNSIK
jgi:hypothetical protein